MSEAKKEDYPAEGAVAVSLSDTDDIHGDTLSTGSTPCRALYVGTTGNISVVMVNDNHKSSPSTVLFSNVPVGIFPIQVVQVKNTDTTASDIVALF
jgi:hypothetical protein